MDGGAPALMMIASAGSSVGGSTAVVETHSWTRGRRRALPPARRSRRLAR
jgi:hypothetical protein